MRSLTADRGRWKRQIECRMSAGDDKIQTLDCCQHMKMTTSECQASCLIPAGLWDIQRARRCLESEHPGPCVFGSPPPEGGAAPGVTPDTRGVGRHRQHHGVPVAVVIARTANWESYDGSKRGQSASSGQSQVPDVPQSRLTTLGSLPGQDLHQPQPVRALPWPDSVRCFRVG